MTAPILGCLRHVVCSCSLQVKAMVHAGLTDRHGRFIASFHFNSLLYLGVAGNAQVYLFQNYALLQRPPDSCLKALDKFTWQAFGLEVQVVHLSCYCFGQ